MMNMTAADVKKDFEAAFGRKLDTLTPDQVRFLADIGRHMRGRCRSNTAMVNWLNSIFPHLRSAMVKADNADFNVLSITHRS